MENEQQRSKVEPAPRAFRFMSNLLYSIIGTALITMAVLSIWTAIHGSLRALFSGDGRTSVVLSSVGLVVLSLALFDVGRYLIEEEVFRSRELRETGEVRQSLTKFLTILIIALGLEALVYVFKAGRSGPEGKESDPGLEPLIYPTLLIVAIAILLFALGWYQRISVRAELSEKRELPRAEKSESIGVEKNDAT